MADMDDTGREGGSPPEPRRIGAGAVKGKPETPGAELRPRRAPLHRISNSAHQSVGRSAPGQESTAPPNRASSPICGARKSRGWKFCASTSNPSWRNRPRDCDLFDVAVSPGERPRLFIDQIGFVPQLAHDQRTYRFLQDTRHGRIKISAKTTSSTRWSEPSPPISRTA